MKMQHKITLIFTVLFYIPQLWAVYTYEDLQKAVDEQNTQLINTILDENSGFLNQKDSFKRTILHYAANSKTNLPNSITVLIQRGADPMATDWQGDTPLHIAVQRGSDQSVIALINTAKGQNKPIDPNAKNSSGRAPLHIMANVFFPSLKTLVNTIHALIEAGADPNLASGDTQEDLRGTPLHLLVKRFASIDTLKAFFDAALQEGKTVEINAQNEYGNTPLHVAARHQMMQKGVFEFLLRADIEVKNKNGQTPLHLAVSAGNETNVATLIERDASITTPDNQGKTPVHLLLDELTKTFPNPEIVNAFVIAAQKKHLNPPPIDLDAIDSDGRTYVHRMVAGIHSSEERAKALNAFYNVFIPFLGQQPPKTNVQDNDGNTPLHIVAQRRDVEAMKVLVANGESDFSIKNNRDRNPLMTVFSSSSPSPQAVLEFFTSANTAMPGKIDMNEYFLSHCLLSSIYSPEKAQERVRLLFDFATKIGQPPSQEALNKMLQDADFPDLRTFLIKKGAQSSITYSQQKEDKPLLAPKKQKIILATALTILASIGLGVAYKKREQLKTLWQKLKSKLVRQKPKKDARQVSPSIF